MTDLNDVKANSGEWVAAYCRRVRQELASQYGVVASADEVRYAAAWYTSVMYKPEDLALVMADPLLRASAGYRDVMAGLAVPDGDSPAGRTEMTFRQALTDLINRYSIESKSNTPDYILANVVVETLDAFGRATAERDQWYGYREATPMVSCGEKVPGIVDAVLSEDVPPTRKES